MDLFIPSIEQKDLRKLELKVTTTSYRKKKEFVNIPIEMNLFSLQDWKYSNKFRV